MSIFDIIVCILAVISVITGWRKGFAVQAFGLAAFVLGVVTAAATGAAAGARLGIDPRYSTAAGFLIIFLCVVVAVLGLGRLIRRLFKIAGLGVMDIVLGILLSLLKTALVLGILCAVFDRINDAAGFVSQSTLNRSVTYRPLCRVVQACGVLGREAADTTEEIVNKTIHSI